MQIPDDLLYTEDHEWIRRVSDTTVRLGITDYAQDQLGDVVFVELPDVGALVAKDDILVEVESTKSVGEVYAPFSGQITAVNSALVSAPELVNQSPYDEAWFVEMEVGEAFDITSFLDASHYRELTE
ncbi:MAG TPA: glycine cleavage system protein GcvH [Acidimicrobiia bacterium]